jgi:phosphatidylethanolamine N-methyltransferase
MRRLYGDSLRKDAGVTQTLRNVARNAARRVSMSTPKDKLASREILERLSKNAREVQGSVEKVFEETAEAVEEFLTRTAPTVKGYVEDTKILLQQSGERFVIR